MPEKPFKILSFGEILWDMLPEGKKLGGAPANFAFHCRELGADSRLLSRIGRDSLGNEILDSCREIGLPTELIEIDDTLPSGTVAVKFHPGGQPEYTIIEGVAWDEIDASKEALKWAAQVDAVAFGSLAARSPKNRQTLEKIIEAVPKNSLRVLDINLRDPFTGSEIIDFAISHASILKLNDAELPRLLERYGIHEGRENDIPERLGLIGKRFGFRFIILTCGAAGGWLWSGAELVHTPGLKVEIVDTIGAGDAFTAACTIGFLEGRPLEEIARKANSLGAFLCTRSGATPKIPGNLKY